MGKKEKAPEVPGSKPLKDPKRELFCYLISSNSGRQFFGNAQNCYAEVYGKQDRLDEIAVELKGMTTNRYSRLKEEDEEDDDFWLDDPKKEKTRKELLGEAEKIKRVCRTLGSRLLTKVDVKARCGFLLDSYISHQTVDRERAKVIVQDHDLQSKMRGIESYDKLYKRITPGDDDAPHQKVEVSFSWEDPEPRPGDKKPLVKVKK